MRTDELTDLFPVSRTRQQLQILQYLRHNLRSPLIDASYRRHTANPLPRTVETDQFETVRHNPLLQHQRHSLTHIFIRNDKSTVKTVAVNLKQFTCALRRRAARKQFDLAPAASKKSPPETFITLPEHVHPVRDIRNSGATAARRKQRPGSLLTHGMIIKSHRIREILQIRIGQCNHGLPSLKPAQVSQFLFPVRRGKNSHENHIRRVCRTAE